MDGRLEEGRLLGTECRELVGATDPGLMSFLGSALLDRQGIPYLCTDMLGSQVSNIVLMLGLSRLLARFDLTTPTAIMYCRIMYAVSQLLQVLAWLYIRRRIRAGPKEEATTMIEVKEPPKPFSSEPPKKTLMSVREYDLDAVRKQLFQIGQGVFFACIMHFWFKFTQPLVFQSIMPWKNFLSMSVVQIRLFGFKAEGALARPWKTPNPFADLMAQEESGQPQAQQLEQDSGTSTVDSTSSSKKTERSPQKESKGVRARRVEPVKDEQ